MMYRLFYVLIFILLISCGSRKVQVDNQSTTEEVNSSVVDKSVIKELRLSKEEYSNLVHDLEIRADSIKTVPGGNTTLYNPSIKTKSQVEGNKKENLNSVETNKNVKTKNQVLKKEKSKLKNVDRKQFNSFSLIVPVLIIVFVVYIFKKKS
ncbi:hypothetical protein [Myroides sp. LoEW2-1]|uniref:hypothetical protein n=1 Tax=Myroides sp. LoEW2-1 TaxID=2683192 RepID=UPI0013295F31|nr:hypothetical protein [Myroides sp. LoEW2-1]MVX36221.1 hypothetical protein [Myroides sp. LoEW2-1]